jgi:hypothetical protein
MTMNVRTTAKVKDTPIGADVRVDAYLTNFSLAYRQDQRNFVAPQAATPISVQKETAIFRTFPRGYFWRDEAEVRALGGRPVQVGYKAGKDSYHAEEWALEHTIDDRERANAAGELDLDESGVMLLEGKQLIRQDRIWAEQVFEEGVWLTDLDGATDFDPFNEAASDPVSLIDTKKTAMAQATGFMPNTLVLGANVNTAIRSNPAMVDRVKYTQTGIITAQLLAALFEVDRVMVARSVYNAAEEGAEDDFEFIVDPNAFWMGYIEPTPRLNAPTAIARFGWTGLIPGAMNAQGGVITRGRDSRAYTDWIHSRNAFDIKRIATDLGMYFKNANLPA